MKKLSKVLIIALLNLTATTTAICASAMSMDNEETESTIISGQSTTSLPCGTDWASLAPALPVRRELFAADEPVNKRPVEQQELYLPADPEFFLWAPIDEVESFLNQEKKS